MNLQALRAFKALLNNSTIKDALKSLGGSRRTLERNIRRLEKTFGKKLIEFKAKNTYHFTQDALRLSHHLETMIEDFEKFHRLVNDQGISDLHIHLTPLFYQRLVEKIFVPFKQSMPEMKLTLKSNHSKDDLTQNRIHGILDKSGLQFQTPIRQRRIMKLDMGLFASRHYIIKNGMPETFEDLKRHPLIVFETNLIEEEVLENLPKNNIKWRVETETSMVHLLQNSQGIGILPHNLRAQYPDLREVLFEESLGQMDIMFYYKDDLRYTHVYDQLFYIFKKFSDPQYKSFHILQTKRQKEQNQEPEPTE